MRNCILFFILFTLFGQVYGQDELVINYDSIKICIENPQSDYYYPKLLLRFNNFDSTLSLQEYAFIYYGFSFQENYLKKPKEGLMDSLATNKNYEALTIECKKILDVNPVSLEANNNMGYSLFKLNRPESEWEKYQNRYRNIRKVIAYSGDGINIETALKVIYVSDEYNMLRTYFEVPKIYKQTLAGFGIDKIEVDSSEYYKKNVIFFDVSRWFIRYQNLMDGK